MMVPVRVVLAVQDECYIEPFLHYVNTSSFNDRMKVMAFSKPDAFLQRMSMLDDRPDVVLAESQFLDAWNPPGGRTVTVLYLVEANQELRDGENHVYKYQPLHELLTSVLASVSSRGNELVHSSDCSTAVIGVYSVTGGSGKTTVALHLVKQLSAEGYRVMYLNLETVSGPLPGSAARFGGEGPGLARLLYDLQSSADRGELLAGSLAGYVSRDSLLQAEAFEPLTNLYELLELDRESTVNLLEYLSASGGYDFIVVDTDSYPCGRTEAVLDFCDQLVWLTVDEIDPVQRTERWLQHLERTNADLHSRLLHKSVFTINRSLATRVHSMPLEQIVSYRTLPYIPAWKQKTSWEAVLHTPDYQRDMMKLCRHITQRAGADPEPARGRTW
ncbi:hypothetical protein [Paenibacillus sp. J22TS3]|uniref:nucleotide-binding protein n=1 Tax=Paenibacillus sp. J22TS3 TaxID=2807192 RepID=UPI001BCFD6C6|nr:hypothetical protein [Paenibacillus sp. J22TS3]